MVLLKWVEAKWHICISKLTIIGSDNGLLPGQRQAIICTNAGILLMWPLGTNLNWNSYIFIHENVLENVFWKMAAILSLPQHCLVPSICDWCAILIAHQIVMAKHGGSCVLFQESPLAGEPRERLFHIHSVHRYQLCAKYLYPSTLLWQINCCNL